MSRIKLLLDVIADVQALSESLSVLAQAMSQNEIGKYETITEEKAIVEETPAPEQRQTISFEQLRGALAQKSREGHTADVRALLTKYGANKLSELQKKDYEAVLAETEAM